MKQGIQNHEEQGLELSLLASPININRDVKAFQDFDGRYWAVKPLSEQTAEIICRLYENMIHSGQIELGYKH